MSQQTIRAYFETKLSTWAATQSPVLRIAYENAAFTPTATETYLETFLLPAYTINPYVSGTKIREGGSFQINIVGIEGKGSKAQSDIALAIRNLFPIVPKDNVVSVEQTPNIMPGIINRDGRWVLPIRISYRLDT